MNWNLKPPSWDFSDVDEAATLPSIETMDESSRYGVHRMNGVFSVDLKLGQVGNSGTESALPKSRDSTSAAAAEISKMGSSFPSGSSKRARAVSNATMTVSCLVDGCSSDLSNCRDYHRRHKVCELHSKTPEVTIGGMKQRFCQQCSRFHSLEQFDERKRSCRKRLDGHNRRRRKPPPEPLKGPGSFLSSYQGTQFPFSSSTAMVSPGWSGGLVNSNAGGRIHNHNQHQQVQHLVDERDFFLGSSPASYKEEKQQLSFLQIDNPSAAATNQSPAHLSAASVCHALLRTSSVHDSPCALSLLSSSYSSQVAHTPGNGLDQMVQPHSMSMSLMEPLGLSLHDNNSSLESMDRVLVHNGSDHCSSMYNIGSDGSQGNEAPQLFPFQWE